MRDTHTNPFVPQAAALGEIGGAGPWFQRTGGKWREQRAKTPRRGIIGRLARRCGRLAAAALVSLLALAAGGPVVAADQVTIAALGDSLTQGYGLPPDQGLVPQLQAWLDARGARVLLVNAGVSGDTTAGGLARLGWVLAPEVQGLMVALGANDLLRGIDPAETRANLDAILAGADARGVPTLLVGLKAPGNYGADYRAAFDAIFPELAARHGALLVDDMLAPLTADMDLSLREYLQADRLHPNARGVELIVPVIGPKLQELAARIRARGTAAGR